MRAVNSFVFLGIMLGLSACSPTVRLQGDTEKPIHIVMDINVRLDKDLDNFFDFENPKGAAHGSATGDNKQSVVTNKATEAAK